MSEGQHNPKIKSQIEDTYAIRKMNNKKAVEYIKNNAMIKENRKANITNCGIYLTFLASGSKQKHKLINANFCRDRFCPMCQWRLSLKESYSIEIVMNAISERLKYDYIFVTFTAPNVKGYDLSDEIKLLSRSFTKMMKRTKLVKSIKGYVRKIEVTYNSKRDDYNQHIHAIMAVEKGYFDYKDNENPYINHDEWLTFWREATGKTKVNDDGTDEISQLDVKKIKDIEGSAKEVGKYTVKSADYLYSKDVFEVLLVALKNKRLIAFGGVFKEYRDLFKKGELDSFKKIDETEYVYRLWMSWNDETHQYKKEYKVLSDEAKDVYHDAIRNNQAIYNIDEI